jgi:hypothetical protein
VQIGFRNHGGHGNHGDHDKTHPPYAIFNKRILIFFTAIPMSSDSIPP